MKCIQFCITQFVLYREDIVSKDNKKLKDKFLREAARISQKNWDTYEKEDTSFIVQIERSNLLMSLLISIINFNPNT